MRFGADPSILYDNKPHIGTDVLSEVIVNMREFLVDKGVTFVFDTCVNNLDIVSQKLLSVYTDSDSNSNSEIKTDVCVLALGHSARDTFDMLYNKGFDMECKSFAVGFRVEHPQRMIDESQYGIQKKSYFRQAHTRSHPIFRMAEESIHSACVREDMWSTHRQPKITRWLTA